MNYSIRRMTPADGQALLELALSSPDTGLIQIAPCYHLDAYQAMVALHPDTIGFVAEATGSKKIIGSGLLGFERICYEGHSRDCAWLHNLQVHPDYRRQGIATALAQCRVAHARESVGEEGVIVASIQQGNTGSFTVARTWCNQLQGENRSGAVGMRHSPPPSGSTVKVRPAQPDDLPVIAAGLNNFYEGWNFYPPHTSESLASWLVTTPFDDPFRHYLVAEDKAGILVAGIGIVEEYRIVEMQVERLPLALRLLNRLVKLVPKDGTMRQLSATKAWFAAGHLPAAQELWETIRWEWRERGNTLTFGYDARSPLKDIFKTPLWIPQTEFTYAVSGSAQMSTDRLIYSG